ncbi:hypothetical protein ECA4442 [Pectobacterium atrosepticum SCRI1043]|uniref:Uncharacterized protein n=1 Tax=Pectobacterium atrosepticum (strain SCRI 1043 / ATCC BAA-672) TaxID=218491 RepID=Q6CYR3_PECAS|nr:hypothetical protein ECA4442 [Pectobacterium atrosepticum SCRI1043]
MAVRREDDRRLNRISQLYDGKRQDCNNCTVLSQLTSHLTRQPFPLFLEFLPARAQKRRRRAGRELYGLYCKAQGSFNDLPCKIMIDVTVTIVSLKVCLDALHIGWVKCALAAYLPCCGESR